MPSSYCPAEPNLDFFSIHDRFNLGQEETDFVKKAVGTRTVVKGMKFGHKGWVDLTVMRS